MRKALLLLLAAGCAAPDAPASDEADFEKVLAQQIPYDVPSLRLGDWVIYTLRVDGAPRAEHVKLSVVAEEGAALWVENKVEFPPRGVIYKSRYERTGKLLEVWVGEPGGQPGRVFPNPRQTDAPPPRRDSSSAQADTREEAETVIAGGRPYPCAKITTTLAYPGGRKSTMTNWCSKEVPFPVLSAGKTIGGIVKRRVGKVTLELSSCGRGDPVRPELHLPR